MLCFFITTVTTNAQTIGYIVYNSLWYRFDRHEKYRIRMIIHRAQQPFNILGLGVLVCSLETFLKVFARVLEICERQYKALFSVLCNKFDHLRHSAHFLSIFPKLTRSAISFYMVFRQLNR